jgi:hypothetical protein
LDDLSFECLDEVVANARDLFELVLLLLLLLSEDDDSAFAPTKSAVGAKIVVCSFEVEGEGEGVEVKRSLDRDVDGVLADSAANGSNTISSML